MVQSDFKRNNSFERRCSLSKKILDNHENKIPIICQKFKNSDIPDLDSNKYIMPSDHPFGKFVSFIRSRVRLPAEKAMYMMVSDGIIPIASQTMSELYDKHKDEDGFLYITVTGENTFGKGNQGTQ